MTDNIKIPDMKTAIPEKTATTETQPGTAPKMTMDYVLEQIEKISVQTEYLNHAIDQLGKIPDGDSGEAGSPGDLAGQAKARAIGDVVRCRETTNQQLLSFYTLLYTDLRQNEDPALKQ